MGRKLKTSIDYFPFDSNVTYNKKIRLLLKDHGHTGFFVWVCLLNYIYMNKGYYMDTTQREEIEVFADEHCRVTSEKFYQIIESCCERRLFDKEIYTKTGALTSHAIQVNYLYGTYEKRRHGGSCRFALEKLCLSAEKLDLSSEQLYANAYVEENGKISPLINVISPRKNELYPSNVLGESTQIRLDNTLVLDKSNTVSTETDLSKTGTVESTENAPKQTETPLPAPIPPSPDTIPSPAKNKGATGKILSPKKRQAKKVVDPDAEPYWKELVSIWFTFCYDNFSTKPTFTGQQPKHMKEIIRVLATRCKEDGKEWTEQEAKLRWRNFLGRAITDKFFKELFILSHLNKFKDKIFFNQSTKNNNGEKRTQGTGSFNRLAIGKDMVFDKPYE